jgi:hypothetical protein
MVLNLEALDVLIMTLAACLGLNSELTLHQNAFIMKLLFCLVLLIGNGVITLSPPRLLEIQKKHRNNAKEELIYVCQTELGAQWCIGESRGNLQYI